MTDIERLLAELKPVLDEISETDLAELEWEKEGRKVKIVRKPVERRKETGIEKKEKPLIQVRSSFVGTFHFFESRPEIGQTIKKGHPLGYIVSVNVKHNVDAETPGKVSEIHAEDGKAVEFGELLFSLEPIV